MAGWNGSAWTELGASPGALRAKSLIPALCTDNKEHVFAAGNFVNSDGIRYVARYSPDDDVDSVVVNLLNNLSPQITTYNGSLQMISKACPLLGNQSVTWSISPVTQATISATGNITAITDGEVWAKATSVENPALSDSVKVTISGQSTGLYATTSSAKGIKIFPVPVTGETLWISAAPWCKHGTVRIYDSRGVLMLTSKADDTTTGINIRKLAVGVYTLQYFHGEERWRATFVRQ